MATMTQRLAGSTAERTNLACEVVFECAANAATVEEQAMLEEAGMMLVKAAMLLGKVRAGKTAHKPIVWEEAA